LNELKRGRLAREFSASQFAADGQAILTNARDTPMQTNYIRFGRRYPIPSTAQILDELKTGFVANYVPISRGYNKLSAQGAATAEHLPARDTIPILIGSPSPKEKRYDNL
jgi:hypothetical protein